MPAKPATADEVSREGEWHFYENSGDGFEKPTGDIKTAIKGDAGGLLSKIVGERCKNFKRILLADCFSSALVYRKGRKAQCEAQWGPGALAPGSSASAALREGAGVRVPPQRTGSGSTGHVWGQDTFGVSG